MKIFSNTNFPSITVKWTIYRGNTQVKEDFSGALFYVFLVNNGNEIKLSASYTNGAIQFTLPIGTEEGQIFPAIGTYGIKAIWVKDAQGHNVNLDLCHKRCLSVIEDLFAISDSEDPGIANTEAAVTLEVKSNIATYGYDGLDSYELAVFMGLTNLDKKNWLANLNEMSVKQAQINNQETARVTEENKRVTAENLRQQTQKALEEQIAEVQDSRVQIDQMLNGGSNRREVSLPLTHFSAVTKTTAATFKMYLGVSEDNEAKVTTAFAKGDNGIYSVEQETGVLYCKIAYIDDTVLGSKSPMIECSQEGVATGKVIGTESIEGSIVYVAADEPTYKLYITVTSAKRSWKEAAFVESGSNFVTSVIDLKDGDQMLSSDSAIEYLYRVNGGVLTTGATLIPTTISSPITTAGKYVYQIATNTPVSEGELKVVKVTVQNQNAKGVYEYLEYLDNGLTIGTESTKPSNVRERYKLVDKNGQQFGSYIDVYKDSSVKEVKLEGQYLKITYILATGAENTVSINLSDFITEAEVGDGLHVVDSKIKVKLNNDPETTNYLKFVGTGSNRALSLEGIENYMNTIEEDRETRYQAAEGTSTTVGGTSRWGRFNQNENSRSATATQRINNCDAAVTRANTAAAGCEAYDTRMSDVEEEVGDLQSEVDDLAQKTSECDGIRGEYIVTADDFSIDGFVNKTGGMIPHQSYNRTDFIKVLPNTYYVAVFCASGNPCLCEFSDDKSTVVGYEENTIQSGFRFKTKENASYIVISNLTSAIDNPFLFKCENISNNAFTSSKTSVWVDNESEKNADDTIYSKWSRRDFYDAVVSCKFFGCDANEKRTLTTLWNGGLSKFRIIISRYTNGSWVNEFDHQESIADRHDLIFDVSIVTGNKKALLVIDTRKLGGCGYGSVLNPLTDEPEYVFSKDCYDVSVCDNLTTDSSTDALSAKQGKKLNDSLNELSQDEEVTSQIECSNGIIYKAGNVNNNVTAYKRTYNGIWLEKGKTITISGVGNDNTSSAVISTDTKSPSQYGVFTYKVVGDNTKTSFSYTATEDCYIYLCIKSDDATSIAYTISRTSRIGEIENDVASLKSEDVAINAWKCKREKMNPNTKLPVVAFVFDDCENITNDKLVVDLFKMNGLTCGFAFIASEANITAKADTYMQYHKEGFDILSHSIDGASITDATALTNISTAMDRLTKAGFIVNGWVSPNSTFPSTSLDVLKKFHAYAYINGSKCSRDDNPCEIIRQSIQSPTLEQIKATIDDAITNDKVLIFYGHTANFGTTYNDEVWNISKVQSVIEYCIGKRDSGLLWMGSPDEAMKYYFDL